MGQKKNKRFCKEGVGEERQKCRGGRDRVPPGQRRNKKAQDQSQFLNMGGGKGLEREKERKPKRHTLQGSKKGSSPAEKVGRTGFFKKVREPG